MGRQPKISLLLLGLILFLASCTSMRQPSPRIDYYTLEYAPPLAGERKPVHRVIKVARFSAAPLYSTAQIIYRDRPFKREAYTYHRWRSTPADLVTYFLSRDLKQSGLFKAVLPHDSGQSSDFIIDGSVDEFLEWDQEDSWEAALTFSVTLMAANEPDISRRVLFQKTYQGRSPCRQKNPRALAEAMSEAMAGLSAKVIADVYEALNKQIRE
ncbi:MAG: membrane integrity-associated transporter subunit PqiC [Deltaproteobacteria bacterium]|nr:membrane integrity-associated transporter subunit PqiC [Deltaproteobacteria bacterium]